MSETAPRLFARAAAAAGIVERSFAIAGRGVVLRFAGPRLVGPLSGALTHHPPAAPGAPTLTVHLWEAGEAAGMPAFPESARDGGITARERIRRPGRVLVTYEEPSRMLCILDRRDDRAHVCVADAAGLPHWELGSPLLHLLQWWMEDHGRQLVHAAALGTERGGVLLVGRGGSGKSTTALATLVDDRPGALRYAGDDYCLVGAGDDPWAYGLYGTGKLDPDAAARFPELVAGPVVDHAPLPGPEKTLFLVSGHRRGRLIDRFPLRALVVPAVGAGPCRVEPIGAGRALFALAPSTVLQRQGAGAPVLATLADLARRVPTFALHLSADPHEAPPVLAALVEELAR